MSEAPRAPAKPTGGVPAPARFPPPSAPRTATRAQRMALLLGLAGALLFSLWLFQGILTPFVLAAVVAYFLDPLATRLARIGVRRGLGAFLLIFLLMAVVLIAVLLFYPLILAQIGILVQRLPAYIAGVGAVLRDGLIRLEEALGRRWWTSGCGSSPSPRPGRCSPGSARRRRG